MRLTQILLHQHIEFMFKKNWIFQGKRVPAYIGIDEMKKKGIEVVDANDYIKVVRKPYREPIIGLQDLPVPLDENHPDWKERECYVHMERNALLEGLMQAQVLTKSVLVESTLPEYIEEAAQTQHSEEVHKQIRTAVLTANIFDCTQVKLPKIKDPERPAVNFARLLGISSNRRNIITTNRLLTILERNSGDAAKDRYATCDANVMTSFEKDGVQIQFQFKSNILVTSAKPMQPPSPKMEDFESSEIPNMHPINHMITIQPEHFYNFEDFYPINGDQKAFHPHTTFLHYNDAFVRNLYRTPVLEKQKLGRSLVHSFTVASAYAKSLYGKDTKVLPKPVTMQCVQTDGCNFYLGVLQLNTLDMNGSNGVKNIWYNAPTIKLFDTCGYVKAIPTLEGYNPNVYNYLHALYNNQ